MLAACGDPLAKVDKLSSVDLPEDASMVEALPDPARSGAPKGLFAGLFGGAEKTTPTAASAPLATDDAVSAALSEVEAQVTTPAAPAAPVREKRGLFGLLKAKEAPQSAPASATQLAEAPALAVEPEIWFLDEPFSALDPLIRREMQDEFLRLQALLKKTIVFITHDFDEAIRLADRIAIMKDGAVIQVATPEQLVLNPASDYVQEFTRHIPRDKVMSVGAIMSKGGTGAGDGIPASAKIADIAAQVVDAGKALKVVDANGQAVGAIDPAAVIDVLINRDT